MKLTTFLFRIFLFALLIAGTIVACKKDNNPTTPPPSTNVNLKKGLLVYLPFDGNIADSSGNGNATAANVPNVLGYDEHGYANMAFNGTGNGEKVIVTNNGSIKWDTAFTVSANVMLRNYGINDYCTYVDRNTAKSVAFGMGTGIVGNPHFVFSTADSTAVCGEYGALTQTLDTAAFIPQPESWYNIVASYNKGLMQVYVNGKLVSTKMGKGTSTLICPSAQLMVGGWWDGDPNSSLNGRLDEFRFYNRLLNADELKELAKDFQNN